MVLKSSFAIVVRASTGIALKVCGSPLPETKAAMLRGCDALSVALIRSCRTIRSALVVQMEMACLKRRGVLPSAGATASNTPGALAIRRTKARAAKCAAVDVAMGSGVRWVTGRKSASVRTSGTI